MAVNESTQVQEWQWVELGDLGVLRVRGADAVRFLQGQLSNDVARVSAECSLLAGYHNPQGRAIALVRLVQLEPDDLLALAPRELVGSVVSRLTKFILRSKVRVTDESALWKLRGLISPGDAGQSPAFPQLIDAQSRYDSSSTLVRIPGERARWLLISPGDEAREHALLAPAGSRARDVWRLLDIAAGLPQVYGATSEEFVAQMLNLDVLGAIAFDKGCYTGQEVIARAHYRGRVKRRMQRFVSKGAVRLSPGDARQLADGRPLKVIEAAPLADGRCELLGVVPLAAGEPAESHAGAQLLEAEVLPLPYALPD
jgi:folate-binding protein YgfZ